jgi:hypothetical protein
VRLGDEPGQGYHQEWFRVPLPRNRADYDGLTNILAKQTIGSFVELLLIRHVEPWYIPACADKSTILIEGANVWRSTEVFLAGVAADEVRVLPDMEGVAATFDMNELFNTKNQAASNLGIDQNVGLTVWTRNGSDTIPVRINGTRIPGDKKNQATCLSERTLAEKLYTDDLTIVDFSPQRLPACADTAQFVVKLNHERPFKELKVLLNGVPSKQVESLPIGRPDSRVYIATFPRSDFEKAKREPGLALAITDGMDISVVPVTLASCDPKPKQVALSMAAAQTFVIAESSKGAPPTQYTFTLSTRLTDGRLPASGVRLGVLPENAPDNAKRAISGGRPIETVTDPTLYTTEMVVKKSDHGHIFDSFTAGRPLKIDLLLIGDEGTSPSVLRLAGKPIFYPTKKNAQIEVTGSGNKRPFILKLTYPVNSGTAFPGLAKARLTAAFRKHADIADLTDIKLTVTPPVPKPDARRQAQISVDVDDASKARFKQIRDDDTTGKKDLFVIFGFEGGDDAVPEITGEFKIEKAK